MKEVAAIFKLIAFLLQAVAALGYEQADITVHHYRQQIYVLEADVRNGAQVSGALAQGSIFGFETLGSLARSGKAKAAVNGMFFDDLGSPAGLLCEGGRWIRISDIGTPSLVIDQTPSVQEIAVRAFWQSKKRREPIYSYDTGAYHGIVNVFTADYGESNRVFRPQVTYRLKEGKVTERLLTKEPVAVGEDVLLTYLLPEDMPPELTGWQQLPAYIPVLEQGEEIAIQIQVTDGAGREIKPQTVYQTGGWLVKDGKIAAKSQEDFIGYTTSLQPRTAVGINQKGNLLFLVADGRQKGVAEGLTGEWLAEVLTSYQVTDAAYLDGGASSMMWLENGFISRPAYPDLVNGKALAHAILLNRRIKRINSFCEPPKETKETNQAK